MNQPLCAVDAVQNNVYTLTQKTKHPVRSLPSKYVRACVVVGDTQRKHPAQSMLYSWLYVSYYKRIYKYISVVAENRNSSCPKNVEGPGPPPRLSESGCSRKKQTCRVSSGLSVCAVSLPWRNLRAFSRWIGCFDAARREPNENENYRSSTKIEKIDKTKKSAAINNKQHSANTLYISERE